MEEDEFKKLIQKAALDEPAALFTDNIMHTIGMHEEFAKNDALGKLLQTALLSNPTEEFTDKIMQQVVPQKQTAFQPIISKKTWRIISGIAALIFTGVILTQFFSKKTVNTHSKFNSLFELNNNILFQIAQQSSIVFTCLVSICTLLVVDAIFRKTPNVSKFV